MILLSPSFVTTVQSTLGTSVLSQTVTDTLYVQFVALDFLAGTITANIERGTMVNGVFQPNMAATVVIVQPDGSFRSNDGNWAGTLGAQAAGLLAQLKATFDQFILAAGVVQGTQE